jgi:hypothetical protein
LLKTNPEVTIKIMTGTLVRHGATLALIFVCQLVCLFNAGRALAQAENPKPTNPFSAKKGIKPRLIQEMEAEHSHKITKDGVAGGAIDVGARFFQEMESSSSNESYDPNYLSTKQERRARWRKFFHPSDYVPNSQWAKKAQEKRDSKKVIKWRGDDDPKLKPDHEKYTQWTGDRDPKIKPDHEKYTQWTGDRNPKIKPDHEKYTQWTGDRDPKIKPDHEKYTQWTGDRDPKIKPDHEKYTQWTGDRNPKIKPDHEKYTQWEGNLPPKIKPDHEKYTQWEGNLVAKRKPNHEQYSEYQGFIKMRRKALRTKLPGYQRRVKTKPHYDRATEAGLWFD